jgi:hypothetical protein
VETQRGSGGIKVRILSLVLQEVLVTLAAIRDLWRFQSVYYDVKASIVSCF